MIVCLARGLKAKNSNITQLFGVIKRKPTLSYNIFFNFRISKRGSSAQPLTLWENKDRELATEVKEESVNIPIPLQMSPQWRELVMEKQKAKEMESIKSFYMFKTFTKYIKNVFLSETNLWTILNIESILWIQSTS